MTRAAPQRVVILGAAGRDFHDFLCWFRDRPDWQVVAFTAEQIPGIAGRRFPAELAGPRYSDGIPILPEQPLGERIRELQAGWVCLAYSDLSHQEVMTKASQALAAGAKFLLLSGADTWVASRLPVVAVTAVRTGSGKSQTARAIAEGLRARGRRPAVIRHSMPYGADLRRQACQRFATPDDFTRHATTIEEEEEYQPWLEHGFVVFAGFDYRAIVAEAEREGDLLLFDGGNNDQPMIRPDVHVVVVDPHRAGHETSYYPGFVNLLTADVVVVNKVDSAEPKQVDAVERAVRAHRPGASILRAGSVIDGPAEKVAGRSCAVVGDGPTLTHGGMPFGAGTLFVRRSGGRIVDPRPYAVGSIRDAFTRFPHLEHELPALGYAPEQIRDLEASLNAIPADLVVDGSPADLARLLELDKPLVELHYELDPEAAAALVEAVAARLR
jgi:predicted GTPase